MKKILFFKQPLDEYGNTIISQTLAEKHLQEIQEKVGDEYLCIYSPLEFYKLITKEIIRST